MAFVVMLGGGIASAWLYASSKHVAVNKETFCPTDRPPTEVVAVLVDASDPLTPVQAAQLRQELDDVRRSIPRYGALEIYRVGRTDQGVRDAIFRVCNPGSPEEIAAWRESPKRARDHWENGFKQPMNRIVDDIVPTNSAPSSPIIESLQSIAVTAFAGDRLRDVPKRLIIVSDMLQHSDALSHYTAAPDFETFANIGAYRNLLAELSGVRVRILYVLRKSNSQIQGREHIQFWQQYFADQGATLVNVKSLSG